MARPISPAKETVVRETFALCKSVRASARAAGVSFHAARRVLGARKPAPADTVEREIGESDGRVKITTRKPIRTEAEAIAHAEIDLTVWRVKKCKITSGEVGMKLRAFDPRGKVSGETPHTHAVWWITLELERIVRKPEQDALDALCARLERKAASHASPARVQPPSDPHLLVLDLVDVHFGKLAWAPETGQHYDLKIAERVYRDAVSDLLSRASGYEVDEYLIPLGSDFLHVDNANGSTTAGTPQDVDGRLAKILETAEAAVVWAVDDLAARGRVVVRWVPGNHDRVLSYCLARVIKARFHGHPGVTVDVGPSPRKYHRYGATLIGLTHGNEEKHSSLPAIMATERPDDWAGTTTREWHVGHLHRSRKLDFMSTDTHNGVPVRTLRSLSAVDAWHFARGYVGTTRSAEAYIYSRESYVGHFVADVRPDRKAS